MEMFSGFAVVFIVVVVVIVSMGAKMVPQGNEYTVERLGKYTKT